MTAPLFGRVASVLPVFLLLAGCSSVASDAKQLAPLPSVQGPTVVDQERGAAIIRGVVIDTEAAPLADARVQILSTTDRDFPLVQVFTDPSGEFRATGLAGGEYAVYVAKRDYLDIEPRIVTLDDGAEAELRFELERRRVYVPFYESIPWVRYYLPHVCFIAAGSFGCLGPGIYFLGSGANETYAYDVDEKVNGELHGVVVEMVWQPNMPGCNGGFRSDVYSPDQGTITADADSESNPYYWTNVPDVLTPTHVLIPRDGQDAVAMHSPARLELNEGRPLETEGKWQVRTLYHPGPTLGTPADFSCAVEQRVTNWFTAFYVRPPPTSDWSALNDA